MNLVPVVLVGLGLVLLVLSPLVFRSTGSGTALSGARDRVKRRKAPQSADGDRVPLEDEKARLIQALRELEEEHDAGRLRDDEYKTLKRKYELEAASVLRTLDRTGPAPDTRPRVGVEARGGTPHWQRGLAWAGVVVAFVGAAGFALMTAVQPRAEGAPMTGIQLGADAGGSGGGAMGGAIEGLIGAMARAAGTVDSSALPALEARLAADSSDLDALVKVGHLYLAETRLADAAHVSMQALEIEHSNMEAHAHVALIFVAQGEINMALDVLNQVLSVRPDFAEALLYRGMVELAQGRDPSSSWERWLEVAPATANTDRIQNMLAAVKARQ